MPIFKFLAPLQLQGVTHDWHDWKIWYLRNEVTRAKNTPEKQKSEKHVILKTPVYQNKGFRLFLTLDTVGVKKKNCTILKICCSRYASGIFVYKRSIHSWDRDFLFLFCLVQNFWLFWPLEGKIENLDFPKMLIFGYENSKISTNWNRS